MDKVHQVISWGGSFDAMHDQVSMALDIRFRNGACRMPAGRHVAQIGAVPQVAYCR